MWTTPAPLSRRWRMIRNSSSISVSVRAAVGSSMIRTSDLNESALAISTICCWATARPETRARGIEVDVELLEQRLGVAVERLLVQPEADALPPRLAPDEDVLGDREVAHQVQLLVDDADPHVLRGARGVDLHLGALDADRAGVGAVDPGQDLHQRGLAGAVLARPGRGPRRAGARTARRRARGRPGSSWRCRSSRPGDRPSGSSRSVTSEASGAGCYRYRLSVTHGTIAHLSRPLHGVSARSAQPSRDPAVTRLQTVEHGRGRASDHQLAAVPPTRAAYLACSSPESRYAR